MIPAIRGTALAALLLAVGVSATATAAQPLPPVGATKYRFSHTCEQYTTSGGIQQVRVTGDADTWVYKMPKKPRFMPYKQQIYQEGRIRLERMSAYESWKGSTTELGRTSFSTREQLPNVGRWTIDRSYGFETATGATFRIKITIRVLTRRYGLPDRSHWKYVAYSDLFSCEPDPNGFIAPAPPTGIPGG